MTNLATENSGYSFHPSILRAYDIRGIVGETLSAQDALHVGKAFCTAVIRKTGVKNPNIALAYDGRLSSPELKDAMIEGLRSAGANVKDFGVGPTPMLYFSVYHHELDAGVMVTGSHNPAAHNGFKMMLGKKSFFAEDIQWLGELAAADDFELGEGSHENLSVEEEYLKGLVAGLIPEGAKELKVAWDPGHGAAADIVSKLVPLLKGEHFVINGHIDGTFPAHHPDPTVPKNLEQLIALVKEKDCDLGVAFDGDGDRIGAVDSTGRILWGDQLMVLFSRDVLQSHPGATIIADVKASQVLFDDVAAHGGKPLMWKTGHSLIKSKMAEEKAKIAGEMSGHIFFADRYWGFDDGVYAAVRLVNLLAHGDESLADAMDKFPVIFNTPELRIDAPDDKKFAIVDEIAARLKVAGADVNPVDGVRVNSDDGWWLARASNTQAAIVVRCEAQNAESLDVLKAYAREQLEASGVDGSALI
jgi:phosphomannomutase